LERGPRGKKRRKGKVPFKYLGDLASEAADGPGGGGGEDLTLDP